jgi:hypothetical protein
LTIPSKSPVHFFRRKCSFAAAAEGWSSAGAAGKTNRKRTAAAHRQIERLYMGRRFYRRRATPREGLEATPTITGSLGLSPSG